MKAPLYLLFALIAAAFAVLRLTQSHRKKAVASRHAANAAPAEAGNADETARNSTDENCDGACGSCISECKMEQLLAPPVYFDDEELDAYAGRPADSYTADETAVFEEVLTTMQPSEVAEWLTSLEQRGVALPDDLKDTAYMLVGESRGGR